MINKNDKQLYALFALAASVIFIPELIEASGLDSASIAEATKKASDTIEILATSGNASSTTTASGSPMLNQLFGGNGTYLLGTLGAGGIAGWAVGFTLKKVAKIVAIILGISVISLQYLAYKSIITIDWQKLEKAVDQQSIEKGAASMMTVLSYNMPFAGTFLVGFWLGFKKG